MCIYTGDFYECIWGLVKRFVVVADASVQADIIAYPSAYCISDFHPWLIALLFKILHFYKCLLDLVQKRILQYFLFAEVLL